jgi:hypothetical protein
MAWRKTFTKAETEVYREQKKAKHAKLARFVAVAQSTNLEDDETFGPILKKYGGVKNAKTGHTLSPRNSILVISQALEQGRKPFGIVAGFRQWSDLGYKVVSGKGSGLVIFRPRTGYAKNEDGQRIEGAETFFAGCTDETVFDFCQVAPMTETDDVKVIPFDQIEAQFTQTSETTEA